MGGTYTEVFLQFAVGYHGDDWELLLVNSEYKTATDEVNAQINELNTILKKYDSKGMLIGEAPCTKDPMKGSDVPVR